MPSLSQTTLSIAILLSAIGTYLSLTEPHDNNDYHPINYSSTSTMNGGAGADDDDDAAVSRILPAGDFMRQFGLSGKVGTTIGRVPCVVLAVHLAVLVFLYPDIPRWLLLLGFGDGDGEEEGGESGSESGEPSPQPQRRSHPQDNDDNNTTTTTTTDKKKQTANESNPPNPPPPKHRKTTTKKNTLKSKSLTPSYRTIPPLLLILLIATPLRLQSYTTLGKNFTFHLAAPDKLVTTGIYSYVQHPSYTGLILLLVGNWFLLFSPEGGVWCGVWLPFFGSLFSSLNSFLSFGKGGSFGGRDGDGNGNGNGDGDGNGDRKGVGKGKKQEEEKEEEKGGWHWAAAWEWMKTVIVPLGIAFGAFTMWKRVMQEEEMMYRCFGDEWVAWHARTARFIPWVF